MKAAVAALALLAIAASAHAEVPHSAPSFAGIFGNHAVLQRDEPITVWGTAAPGAQLVVELAGQSTTTTVDAAGKWRAELPKMSAGGPYSLSVSANRQQTTLKDILVGDVLLCSGQSNMALSVDHASGAMADISTSANPHLRFVNIAKDSQPAALADLGTPATWTLASPQTTGEASAVCYHMARSLQKRYGIPIGFVNASWGGTAIQPWIGASALRTLPRYRAEVDSVAGQGSNPAQAFAKEAMHFVSQRTGHLHRLGQGTGFPRRYVEMALITLLAIGCLHVLRPYMTAILSAAFAAVASRLYPRSLKPAGEMRYPGVVTTLVTVPLVVLPLALVGPDLLHGPDQAAGVADAAHKNGQTPAHGPQVDGTRKEVSIGHATLFNGMIAPLAGYKFRFAAWYQGESNVAAAQEYKTLLPMLMSNWRQTFGQDKLPFLVVQLASYGQVATTPGNSTWAELRDAQLQTVHNDAHAALAVTLDYGDRSDIHPAQKAVVGERLARAARAVAYGERVSPGGPEAVAAERHGADIVIRFKDTNGGLRTYSSNVAIAFETCGDKGCRYVPAQVDGDRALLAGANTTDVKRVRYAWSDAPYVNLYSADDLPAVPFQIPVH